MHLQWVGASWLPICPGAQREVTNMPYDMSKDQGHCSYPRMSDLESVTEQEDISPSRFPSPKGLMHD